MTGLTLNYGDAWGLGSNSRNSQIATELVHSYKERVAEEVMSKSGCDRQMFEDCWNEVGRKDQLPATFRVIKRNEFYRNKVLDSLKKELGDEVFNNKSYTTAMFEEKDIVACEKLGVTPADMVDFLKSLY